jgi:hypothetical protein
MLQTLRNLSTQLGRKTLSKSDIAGVLSLSVLKYHFGSLGKALETAGLDRTLPNDHFRGRGNLYSDDDLLRALWDLENQLGHEPTQAAVSAQGKLSPRPFRRFGNWQDVMARYRIWKSQSNEDGNLAKGGSPQFAELEEENQAPYSDPAEPETGEETNPLVIRQRRPPGQLYGEPIDFRGLRHAPINEQGVVFLFGMVSRELGFSIESIQQGFPDCGGKYLHDRNKNLWAKARIEFEYRASNFRQHGHDPNQCDFIVCWINDWPDCPIEVIELKKELLKLRSH